jgi:S-(hydroxymethyl)glutathione dehydrogenase / alcohol dehydrogenase
VRTRAALFDGTALTVVDDLEVEAPGPGEVRVRLLASGICHSDLNVLDGHQPVPPPVILGHEAAGVVAEVGPGVAGWSPGDAVAVVGLTGCATCRACRTGHPAACVAAFAGPSRFQWHGRPVRTYANVSSFAEHITVPTGRLVSTDGIAPAAACLIGCALTTGWGVVNNVAHVAAGDRAVVFGVGGIGVAAIQSAVLNGAEVHAVDVRPEREAVARRFGASGFSGPADVSGDYDVVIECSGAPSAIDRALALAAPGGAVALVGLPPVGHRAAFDVGALMRGRRILGSLNGDLLPDRDLPVIVDLVRSGRLDAAGLVTRTWPLAEIDAAVTAARQGGVLRAVIAYES